MPNLFECPEGYEINDTKTACVPSPGECVPFPFIIGAVFMSLLVLGSYLKDNQVTKVLTNLICLIGGFEIFIYCFMVGFAIYLEEWLIFLLTLFGLVSLMGCNIMYFVYYKKEIDED